MFIKKSSTEIITIKNEIKIVGLSLQKSGLPISYESLGALWGNYSVEYRNSIANLKTPVDFNYAICWWENNTHDYIVGNEVSEFESLDDKSSSYVIPTGKYIKDFWNAETFDLLVTEEMGKRNVADWAKQNNIEILDGFSIEVYPQKNEQPENEMYTLTPIK